MMNTETDMGHVYELEKTNRGYETHQQQQQQQQLFIGSEGECILIL